MANYNGIDISKWQGEIDWAKVKAAGIDFAMIRSSARSNYTDPCLEANVKGCEAHGIAYGFYHYSYATTVAAAQAEADYFLKVISKYSPTMPVCFDIEDPTQENLGKPLLTAMTVAFLDKVEKAGYYSMLYTNLLWLNKYLDYEQIKRFDIWLAAWRDIRPNDYPHGIWQNAVLGSASDVAKKYASKVGSIPGIDGCVDVDIAYKDYPALIKRLGLNNQKTATFTVTATKPELNIAEAITLETQLKSLGMTVTKEQEK